MMDYQDLLKRFQDEFAGDDFLAFSIKILATEEKMVGVKMPELKKIAKEAVEGDLDLDSLPIGELYETDVVHLLAFLSKNKNDEDRYAFLKDFLAKTDGWSLGDTACLFFKKTKVDLAIKKSKEFLKSPHTWVRRFAYTSLIQHSKVLKCQEIESLLKEDKEFYVNVAIAWLLSFLAIHDFDGVSSYLKSCPSAWIKKKSFQKCCESRRITPEQKAFLKSL